MTYSVFISPSGVAYIYKNGKQYCAFHHAWHGVADARTEAQKVCDILNKKGMLN